MVEVLYRRAIHDGRPREAAVAAEALVIHRRGHRLQAGIDQRVDGEGRVVPLRRARRLERVHRDRLAVVAEGLGAVRLAAADDVRELGRRARVVEALNGLQHLASGLAHRVRAVVEHDGAERGRRVAVDDDQAGAERLQALSVRHRHRVEAVGRELAALRVDVEVAKHVGAIRVGAVRAARAAAAAGACCRAPGEQLAKRPVRAAERVAAERYAQSARIGTAVALVDHLPVEKRGGDVGAGRHVLDRNVAAAAAAQAHPPDDVVAGDEVVLEERQGLDLRARTNRACAEHQHARDYRQQKSFHSDFRFSPCELGDDAAAPCERPELRIVSPTPATNPHLFAGSGPAQTSWKSCESPAVALIRGFLL